MTFDEHYKDLVFSSDVSKYDVCNLWNCALTEITNLLQCDHSETTIEGLTLFLLSEIEQLRN